MSCSTTIMSVQKKSEILPAAEEFAFYELDRREGSTNYHGNLTIVEDKILGSYGAAYNYLYQEFNERYHDGAVRYKDYSNVIKPQYLIEKEERYKTLTKELEEMKFANHFVSHSSKFISCPECKSKINSEYIKQVVVAYKVNRCPVCNADMRPKSTLTQISKKENTLKDFRESLKTAERKFQEKQKSQAEIRWAVKVSVHS